ncbi:MAG: glycosyltransferase family 1 protein, partial [Acidobacteriota bacterium]
MTETFPPEVNGVARTLRQLLRGLAGRGHQVQLVRPRQARPDRFHRREPWQQLLVRGLPLPFYRGLRFGLPSLLRLRRSWSSRPPDAVHIATEGPLGLGALFIAGRLGIPVMSSFHTNFHQYGRHYGYGVRFAIAYLRWFHNRTRRTLVPSQDVRDALARDGFLKLEILGRGVDGELFHPSRRSESLRSSWGADSETPVAVYVGRLAEEKNPDLLLRALEEFRRACPRGRTVLVGDGPAADRMRRLDSRSLFCGVRRGEDLARHYASADVMLSPSSTETFGNVVLEAMASGLPVLCFDYAAGRQVITPRRNGFLAAFGDDRAFLEETRTLAAMPMSELRALGRAARAPAPAPPGEGVVSEFETRRAAPNA